MKKKSIGIGLMGLGVVAGGVARVLINKAEVLAEQVGCPLVLRKVKVLEPDLAKPLAKEMVSSFLPPMLMSFLLSPG